MYFPLLVGVLCLSLFCYELLCVHSSFAIILKTKMKLVALLLLSYRCIVTINVLWLFLTLPWVGLLFVIVVFPDHTHLLFNTLISDWKDSKQKKSVSDSKYKERSSKTSSSREDLTQR